MTLAFLAWMGRRWLPNIANAYVIIVGEANRRTNEFGQAFRMTLLKQHGRWLINQVHNVHRL